MLFEFTGFVKTHIKQIQTVDRELVCQTKFDLCFRGGIFSEKATIVPKKKRTGDPDRFSYNYVKD